MTNSKLADIQRYIDGEVLEYVEEAKEQSEFGPRHLLAQQIFKVRLTPEAAQSAQFYDEGRYAEAFYWEAEEHWDIERLYRQVVSTKVDLAHPLNEWERRFITRVLGGDWEPKIKRKRGSAFEENWDRNFFIVLLLVELRDNFHIRPTRNDEKKHSCADSEKRGQDIISAAFIKAGRHEVTPKAVKSTWVNKEVRKWAQRYFHNLGHANVFKDTK
ncbi:hypothetical protein NBRC116594_25080 [Shimia sp. NS0008-38b]|uniref:hypothetical protein n=1 Tax=Shimia sp. NS0008-38b TaxID=3127653 RepID=UPI00310BAFFC